MKCSVVSRITGEVWKEYCKNQGLDVVSVNVQINDEGGVIKRMSGYNAVIAGGEPFSRRVLDALKGDLRIIARQGIGYDKIDVDYATKLGICVCNAPGSMSKGVAETALILMMELARRFYQRNESLCHGRWDKGQMTHQFEGSTIGLLGFGNIAQCLARYLSGFKRCRVLAYDIQYNEEALARYNVRKASLEEVARESDFVSVHVPLMPATSKMVNADFLSLMKPTAYLINTSRGGTVDEAALIDALKKGTIAGAGLDVFSQEPTDASNELLAMENVFKTPHIATNTYECAQAGFDCAIQCVKDFVDGKIPRYALNPDYVDYSQKNEEA